MTMFRFRSLCFLILSVGCGFFPPFTAVSVATANEYTASQEYKIKAGLVYNFLKYSSWPSESFADPSESFQVCLLGGDTFDGALDAIQGRTAQQRSIHVKAVSILNMQHCHMVFIPHNEERNLPYVLGSLYGRNVMSISDIEGFVSKGGMVEFSKSSEKRLQLRLNQKALDRARLDVGEQLTKLAEVW